MKSNKIEVARICRQSPELSIIDGNCVYEIASDTLKDPKVAYISAPIHDAMHVQ
jgi:hypothetical protein